MKKIKLFLISGLLVFAGSFLQSCEEFLNEKETHRLVIPESLNDLQALMDNVGYMNYGGNTSILELATDDYYVAQDVFNGLADFQRDNYLWKSHPEYLLNADINFTWYFPYRIVNIANTVLDELPSIKTNNVFHRNEVQGAAYFHRAFAYFHLTQAHVSAFDANDASNRLGIPMRLKPDSQPVTKRVSMQETYDQIIRDLKLAAEFLPLKTLISTRPSKVAAWSALAKVYLVMADYEQALQYANLALTEYTTLIDYGTISPTKAISFERFNEETIFYAYSSGFAILNPSRARVSRALYGLYDAEDLRKKIYFNPVGNDEYSFKGAYSGLASNSFFIGLTTSELYLIQAECFARTNQAALAMQAMNTLLSHRYLAEDFRPWTGFSGDQLLFKILEERRKELIFRGVRWSDLKRLNKEGRFTTTLERRVVVDGVEQVFMLPPNDLRYDFLIPQEVILQTGMEQNPRN